MGLFDIVTEIIENVPVIKIIVFSGLEKPYYIRSQGMSPSGCFARGGTATQPMTTDLIENEEYGYCSLIKATKNVLDKLKIENIILARVTSTTRILYGGLIPGQSIDVFLVAAVCPGIEN